MKNIMMGLLFPVKFQKTRAEINAAIDRYVENTEKCKIFHKAISSRELLRELKNDVEFLQKVVDGTKSRDYIKSGLCVRLNNSMAKAEFLRGYKYWSGGLGFIIRTPISFDARDQYLAEKEDRYSDSQIMYYQARQELAKHWLNILRPIYEDAKLCRS